MREEATASNNGNSIQGSATIGARSAPPLDSRVVALTAKGDNVEMDTITESTLAEFIENGAVAGITLKETDSGFLVRVTVLWDANKEFTVITQRAKKPRVWSSLNRLVQHLGRYPNLPPIKLEVKVSKHASGKQPKSKKA